jgi:hypothetical protein
LYTSCVSGVPYAFNDISITYKKVEARAGASHYVVASVWLRDQRSFRLVCFQIESWSLEWLWFYKSSGCLVRRRCEGDAEARLVGARPGAKVVFGDGKPILRGG